jgi:hypothetical protein
MPNEGMASAALPLAAVTICLSHATAFADRGLSSSAASIRYWTNEPFSEYGVSIERKNPLIAMTLKLALAPLQVKQEQHLLQMPPGVYISIPLIGIPA